MNEKKKFLKTIYKTRLSSLFSNSQNKCKKLKKLSLLSNSNLT